MPNAFRGRGGGGDRRDRAEMEMCEANSYGGDDDDECDDY